MANIRVKAALERIGAELSRVRSQVSYSGISKKDARLIDNMATDIAVEAAMIAAEARAVNLEGLNMPASRAPDRLVMRVRQALGFTYP